MFLSRAALSTTMQTMQTTKQTRRRRRNNRGFGIGLRREERSSGVLVRGRRDDDDDDDDDMIVLFSTRWISKRSASERTRSARADATRVMKRKDRGGEERSWRRR